MTASDDYRDPVPRAEYDGEQPDAAQEPANGLIFSGSEDLSELEELEAIEEVSPTPEAAPLLPAPADAAQESELAALVSAGKIRAWTIDELSALVRESASAVVMEDGVFRIRDEVYAEGDQRPGSLAESELRQLAQEVVEHAASESVDKPGEEAPLELTSAAGIGDLLRDEDTLDLSQDISAEKGLSSESSLSIDREKSNPVHLKRNGLDYDDFLSSYPRSFTHTTQMKSLVEVSRRVTAVNACLFLKKGESFVPGLTIGLSEKSVQACTFARGDPLLAEYFLSRKAVSVDTDPAEIRFLGVRFDPEDIRYMKRILFLPAVFESQDAYLFLSFSGKTDISISSILAKLIVRP